MNNFLKGVLVGVGLGLLFAPKKGEETRQMLAQRYGQLRSSLPENEQLELYRQNISNRVNTTADILKGYAQQAASTVKSSASSLSNIAQNAASTVKTSGEDIKETTKEAVETSKRRSSGAPPTSAPPTSTTTNIVNTDTDTSGTY